LIRLVGLKAVTASSRVETLPMCVRSRPSRTRRTISVRNRLRGGPDGLLRLFVVCAQQQFAHLVLCGGIADSPKQREVPSIAVHDELARREGAAVARALAPAPDGKANELQPLELAADEVDLRQRACRRASRVGCEEY
jgi:hypothetical protein